VNGGPGHRDFLDLPVQGGRISSIRVSENPLARCPPDVSPALGSCCCSVARQPRLAARRYIGPAGVSAHGAEMATQRAFSIRSLEYAC